MRFVEFVTINPQNGTKATMSVNPEMVCFVAPAIIPGEIAGPDGTKIGKTVAVIGFGVQTIIVDCNQNEAKQRLEGRLGEAIVPPLRIVKFPQDKRELAKEKLEEEKV